MCDPFTSWYGERYAKSYGYVKGIVRERAGEARSYLGRVVSAGCRLRWLCGHSNTNLHPRNEQLSQAVEARRVGKMGRVRRRVRQDFLRTAVSRNGTPFARSCIKSWIIQEVIHLK